MMFKSYSSIIGTIFVHNSLSGYSHFSVISKYSGFFILTFKIFRNFKLQNFNVSWISWILKIIRIFQTFKNFPEFSRFSRFLFYFRCEACGAEGDHRLLPLYCHMEKESKHPGNFRKKHTKASERYHPSQNHIFQHPGQLYSPIMSNCICGKKPQKWRCCKKDQSEEGCQELWACCKGGIYKHVDKKWSNMIKNSFENGQKGKFQKK